MEGSANNAAEELRGDTPVFHPKDSAGKFDTLPIDLVRAPREQRWKDMLPSQVSEARAPQSRISR